MLPLSANQIEGAALTGWPALKEAYDGLWLWRYANGFTRRANSIQCLDPVDGAFAEERLERLSSLSRRHQLAPIFRVTPLTAPEVLEVFDRRGWPRSGESLVMSMETPVRDYPVEQQWRAYDVTDPEWSKTVATMSAHSPQTTRTLQAILDSIACEARGITLFHKAGVPVACALATVASDIGMYFNVVVHPNARRGGFGRAVMGAAINWTRSAGALYSAIQVAAENTAALNLYRSLGFAEAYPYHYRTPPDVAL